MKGLAPPYRGWLNVVLGGLVVVAWLVLWWLETTPLAMLLHLHDPARHMAALPVHSGFAFFGLFLAGWVLMSIAMMLPSTFPLIQIFQRLVRNRRGARRLTMFLAAGYMAAWAAFGVFAYFGKLLADAALQRAVPFWLVSALLFIAAGAFQFSTFKYRCLQQCQTPLSFVLRRWNATAGEAQALRLGAAHGVYCIGCCWALMVLMFAASTAHLLWMLALGVLMGIEKNSRWGLAMGRPLGAVLILCGLGLGAWGATA